MKSIRKGDLVRFAEGKSKQLEKVMFPFATDDDVYLVIDDPKMTVYSTPGVASQETLSVEIMIGTKIKKIPVNALKRVKKDKKISAEKL